MIWADNTRILAIFAVVVLHIAAGVVLDDKNYLNLHWMIGNIYDAFVRWSVPVFVMLSGALLLSDDKIESMRAFYYKRATRLLIPLVFWTIFYTGLSLMLAEKGHRPPPATIIKNVMLGRPYFHMWFIYMITGLYFATPYIRILIRNMSTWQTMWFTVALFAMAMATDAFSTLYAHSSTLFINRFFLYVPYFILGYLIRKLHWQPRAVYSALIFILSGVLTMLGFFMLAKAYNLNIGLYFYDSLGVTVLPMSISAMLLLQRLTKPILNVDLTKKLASLVFGVYLIHPFIIAMLDLAGIKATQLNPVFWIPVFATIVFMISAVAAWGIQSTPYVRRIV